MKKAIIGTVVGLLISISTAKAEVKYDYKNPEHTIDKNCMAYFGWAREVFHAGGNMESYKAFTDWQNTLILKYAYSKQLNTHVDVYKTLIKQKVNNDNFEWKPALQECIERSM